MTLADVVVPIFRDLALTRQCVDSVLQLSGPALGRLLLVDDASTEPQMDTFLEDVRARDHRVRILRCTQNGGFVRAANLGLAAGEIDCVVLNSDARVTQGWLVEILEAMDSSPQCAALAPLSNNATMCSVPHFGRAVPVAALEGRPLDLSRLPRITPMPTVNGFCVLFRRAALREIGLFDRKYGHGYHEENDWCQRARAAGYFVGRANRALVYHHGSASFGESRRKRLDVVNERRLVARYPWYLADNARFQQSPAAAEAARVVLHQLHTRPGPL